MMVLDPKQLMITAYDANDALIRYPKPLELEIVKSFDSPAFALEVIFPFPRVLVKPVSITARCKLLLFDGYVDEMTVTIGPEGRRLKILARSKGARLIDNEALPRVYYNVKLPALYQNHLVPYGFNEGIETDCDPMSSVYMVLKGESEWEAFSNFFRNTGMGTAYIDDSDQIICMNLRPTPALHTFNNADPAATHYSNIAITNNLYSPITKFIIRDDNGEYSYTYVNPFTTGMSLTRNRYLIPTPEYTQSPTGGRIDAAHRCVRSMLGMLVITLTCPGLLNVRRAEHVNLNTGFEQYTGLFVMQVRHKVTGTGAVTILTLVDKTYV